VTPARQNLMMPVTQMRSRHAALLMLQA